MYASFKWALVPSSEDTFIFEKYFDHIIFLLRLQNIEEMVFKGIVKWNLRR